MRQRSGGSPFEASLGKQFVTPYLEKNPSQKTAGGVAQGETCVQTLVHKKKRQRRWWLNLNI
jgi:hypothetical protein